MKFDKFLVRVWKVNDSTNIHIYYIMYKCTYDYKHWWEANFSLIFFIFIFYTYILFFLGKWKVPHDPTVRYMFPRSMSLQKKFFFQKVQLFYLVMEKYSTQQLKIIQSTISSLHWLLEFLHLYLLISTENIIKLFQSIHFHLKDQYLLTKCH